jgi:hypothetical protein
MHRDEGRHRPCRATTRSTRLRFGSRPPAS